jgi:APA family basic amino acid/polyamine antiporter
VQRKSTHALFECVPLDAAQVEAQGREDSGVRLNRSLGIASLAMLGVGNAIGAGIFVLTGTAAAQHAGPGIAISYLIAGLVCALTSLCYAELSSLIPSAGGAFAYARVSIGKLGAWLIGWCMIAEYLLAGATVAVGWSGYAQGLLQQLGIAFPEHLGTAPLQVTDGELVRSGALVNMPAFLLVAVCTVVLMRGLRHSTIAGHLMVGVKIVVIVLVLVIGFGYVSAQNWDPFIPAQDAAGRFGWGGVLTASAIAFYSYSGFEAMSAAAVEARDPARTLPRALLWALAICVLLYVAMAHDMTGL